MGSFKSRKEWKGAPGGAKPNPQAGGAYPQKLGRRSRGHQTKKGGEGMSKKDCGTQKTRNRPPEPGKKGETNKVKDQVIQGDRQMPQKKSKGRSSGEKRGGSQGIPQT